MGVTSTKMKTATAMLEAEGYHVHKVKVQQQTTGKFTEMKVLVPPGHGLQDGSGQAGRN